MNKKVFFSFLRIRIPQIVTALICLLTMALVLWLYGEPLMPVVLAAAIMAVLAGIFWTIDYRSYKKKHDSLEKALAFPEAFAERLTGTDEEEISEVEEKIDLIETDYRLLLVKLSDTLSKE